MKNKSKTSGKAFAGKIISLSLALMLLIGAAVPAFAADADKKTYRQLLVLGDSITTGYGLQNYTVGDPYKCPSYANKLAAALGLEAGSTYINKAVNGDKSSNLLALLPSVKSYVEKSDLIIISIGGNEILGNLAMIASAVSGKTISSLAEAMSTLLASDAAAFAAAAANAELQAQLTNIVKLYTANMQKIVSMLKSYNPDARVLFLAQYNPLNKVPGIEPVNSLGAPMLASINAAMKLVVETAGYEIVDVPSVIDDFAAARTNILTMDIHPNSIGHDEIYKLLLDYLDIGDASSAPAETTECEHEFGEWKEISEGKATEPWTGERECKKCGEKETAEFPARETEPEVTTADVTEAVETTAPETVPAEKKGCGSFAALAFLSVASGAAMILFRRKTVIQ
ncbi:MAG: SGNH/GDSL hydrolase family protein [Clostridia bacterium]|nr:SGNH/GDSL hydrolase family protein [Clostridia bacterium]